MKTPSEPASTPHGSAVVLFAHGSRDPLWRASIDAVAARLRAMAPSVPTACAFLELMVPTLDEAVDALVRGGARQIRVLPLFLGVGRHAREDLPALLAAARAQHPGVRIDALPPVGEDPRVIDLLARIALD